MAGDEAAHHVGLAPRPEGRAAALPLLGFDQAVNDLAALDQELVQLGIDAIDLNSKVGQRFQAGRVGHGQGSRGRSTLS